MSKVGHYLQEHLMGEVIDSSNARAHFATDGSIFQVVPSLVVYPKNENDIRKAARFSWQLAERGRIIPLTARGLGTDQSGAAIGSGMVLVFPAHMNKIIELETKSGKVTVEAGINYGKLQQTLHTHGRFLPPYPPSLEYSTLAGAISNNSSGEKSIKYGNTLDYVKSLRVVIANGEVIETKRLSKRELSKKLGLATFEGEIYRSIDTLLEEQHELIEGFRRSTVKNNAGYNLLDIKHRDGSFDLTPLIAGSQGTLGIITEAVVKTEAYDPRSSLIMANFDSMEHMQQAIIELKQLPDVPSAIEVINSAALQQIDDLNPNFIKDIIKKPFPQFILMIEFDGEGRSAKKSIKRVNKILEKYSINFESSDDLEEQQKYRKVQDSTNVLIAHNEGLLHPVPLFDGAVPTDRLREYIDGLTKIMKDGNSKPALWGHIGEGGLSAQPKLNLGHVGDRQKAFRMMDEHIKLVLELGGTISSSEGDGRLKTPYLEKMYGNDLYNLLYKVKQIFDPYGILNPGVKFGTSVDDLKAIVRPDFNLKHLYDYLPRT
jgi:FAD/FMN-containing dehydrogenase